MLVAVSSPLTRLIPGLMIWTIIFFLIVFFVLRKYAFASIQKIIDDRREAIRRSIEAADHARDEAQRLLEEHRKLLAAARGQGEEILAEARRTRASMEQRMREETESQRQPRREATRKDIAAETARALAPDPAGLADLARGTAALAGGRWAGGDREGVRAADGRWGAAADRGADDGARADRRRGEGDPAAERGCGRPQGRGDTEGRSRARGRHRPAGGLAPRRRERARETG